VSEGSKCAGKCAVQKNSGVTGSLCPCKASSQASCYLLVTCSSARARELCISPMRFSRLRTTAASLFPWKQHTEETEEFWSEVSLSRRRVERAKKIVVRGVDVHSQANKKKRKSSALNSPPRSKTVGTPLFPWTTPTRLPGRTDVPTPLPGRLQHYLRAVVPLP
jgi:hypothetical protein